MVDRPIALPTGLGDDVWSRVHQMRMGDRVRPVRDHNRNQREDQEEDRRDTFEQHITERQQEQDAQNAPPQQEQLVLRFMRELPLEPGQQQTPRLPGMGKNLDLQA